MKSLELRLHEAYHLVKNLEQALARERGGGSSIDYREYMALRDDARIWLSQNKWVKDNE